MVPIMEPRDRDTHIPLGCAYCWEVPLARLLFQVYWAEAEISTVQPPFPASTSGLPRPISCTKRHGDPESVPNARSQSLTEMEGAEG